jgi:prepilin-type N-terminal cleavage/methylation domain-containing protein
MKKNKGFTLIELMVVVGILAAMIVGVVGHRGQPRDAQPVETTY